MEEPPLRAAHARAIARTAWGRGRIRFVSCIREATGAHCRSGEPLPREVFVVVLIRAVIIRWRIAGEEPGAGGVGAGTEPLSGAVKG